LKKIDLNARSGRDTIFTQEEEQTLVDHIRELAEIGFLIQAWFPEAPPFSVFL